MPILLGIDIGTTSTIGILIDTEGRTLATASRPSDLRSLRANWAEEDPNQWWANACAIVPELCRQAGCAAGGIAAAGATGMVPAVVLLDRQGRVLRPSMQQNDARALHEIAEMRASFDGRRFLKLTGGSINQQLVAPKLRWIARHEPEVFRQVATVLGSYDYIAYRLAGSRSVDHNWALESGLMDFAERRFTPELIAPAGIDAAVLPAIHASHEVVGQVTPEAAAASGLRAGIPVVAGCADHVASAYAAGAVEDGDLVLKFGGAGDILLCAAKPVTDPRLFIDYHIIPHLYFSNGCMATTGSMLNWIVDQFAEGERAYAAKAGSGIHAWLDRKAEAVPAGSEGVVLLPYFLGEKTPLHDPYARGTLVGLALHHGLAHVSRAAARDCSLILPVSPAMSPAIASSCRIRFEPRPMIALMPISAMSTRACRPSIRGSILRRRRMRKPRNKRAIDAAQPASRRQTRAGHRWRIRHRQGHRQGTERRGRPRRRDG